MLRSLLASILLMCSLYSVAQQKSALRGTVADSTNKELLEMASVSVQDPKDSSLITYTLTDKKGAFVLNGLPENKAVRLLISYTGYRTYTRILDANRPTDLGQIFLPLAARDLNTVVIEGDRPPVAIRADTIEFNAASFKTRPNAVVEDLLKKLPGVDIDEEGGITVNGKKVSRILVDGREFFANDPKLATKNLPSNIIDKVQVMDTKTKQEAKMGITKDGEDRTINLTLKADKKRGLFGRISAGYGTDERFEAGGMVNYFNGPKQISVLGSSNNLNKMGFTQGEMMSVAERKGGTTVMVSGAGIEVNGISFGGGGEGIRTASMLGYNYNDKWGDKTGINNSYFFNNTNSRNYSISNRQRLIDNYRIAGIKDGYGRNANHRMNFGVDIELDSMTQLNIRPSFDYSRQSMNNNGDETTWDENNALVNTNKTNNRSLSTRYNFQNNIDLTRQFKKKGRSIGLNFSNTYNTQDGNSYVRSDRDFYENELVDSTASTNQRTISDNKNENYKIQLSYNEPLSPTWRMTLTYAWNYNLSKSNRRTYNYNEGAKDYTDLDSLYTNQFRTLNTSQQPQVSFNYTSKDKKLTANLGGMVYLNVLDNYSLTDNTTLRQYQTNLAPNSRISYRFKNNAQVNLDYNGYMQQPSLDQLQPVLDNTNTLNIRVGNPDLKPSFSQNIRLGYNIFSPTGFGIFSGIGISPVLNRISTATRILSGGGQETKSINVDGTYSLNANVNVSMNKKKKDYQWRINGGFFGNGSRNVNFSTLGNAKGDTVLRANSTMNWSVSPMVNFSYSYKELLDVTLMYRPSFNAVQYSVTPPNSQNSYYMHRANIGATLYWPYNFSLENDVNYTFNSRTSPGFRKGVVLWNMGLAYDFFKDKSLQVKVSAYDLLRQNTSVRRMQSDYYIDDIQTNIVEQYFMVTVSYNISRFGGKPKGGPNRRYNNGGFMMF
ncbi:outer membrane beta-barrel protein [Chitinophaga sp. SYP-B3965]|uniref:outer membrane beta-barrel protein n=1 Tax=Chitinophaga sp. SYP-B3965 TaxID=2663120 RepID=UPI001299807D|nr:outer membrane beta-barrel protein [Chitinophaga sp. SYP-B3965]MRG45949.1 outer membrane beta-barrel protein [Chitinophaga sp. SYP-B3965]